MDTEDADEPGQDRSYRPKCLPTTTDALIGKHKVKNRLEQLAQQACNETAKLAEESYTVWGTRVHKRFADLVRAERAVDPKLHAEISYLDGAEVQYGTANSRRVDVVYGPTTEQPEIMFDPKTGKRGLSATWLRELGDRLPTLYQKYPSLEDQLLAVPVRLV